MKVIRRTKENYTPGTEIVIVEDLDSETAKLVARMLNRKSHSWSLLEYVAVPNNHVLGERYAG